MAAFEAYNGVSIPSFMYGTAWKKDATARLVEAAVAAGFTAIDTANQIIHYDEALVGDALEALASKGIARGSLFLQTKFTPAGGQDHRTPYDPSAGLAAQVAQSFASSLAHLHTDYVDSYVLHGPHVRAGLSDADWEVWEAIEGVYRSGKARMIGVSNVSADQLRLLCDGASVTPMVVQNRCYAALGWDREVREVCRDRGIVYQGFSLLTANRGIFGDPALWEIAARLGVEPAPVIFRFATEVGILPLTGTTNESHMGEDLRSLALQLSGDEIAYIEAMGG
jgi:diketogulonate reductase-like aldo/keto reductase